MKMRVGTDVFRAALFVSLGLTACKSAPKKEPEPEGTGSAKRAAATRPSTSAAPAAAAPSGALTVVGTPRRCEAPERVVIGGKPTGFVRCQGGWLHREAALPCPDNGAANNFCTTDADCKADALCLCGEQRHMCIRKDCARDADCKDGALCVRAGVFRCQNPKDQCMVDADCDGTGQQGRDMECELGAFNECEPEGSAGRPYLVDGTARLAAVGPRHDWSRPLAPGLTGLTDDARDRLRRYWTTAARYEHASVAAFARFALQLLAVGAPPDMVVETQQAMADEIEHARLCFGLASAFADAPLGPDALDSADALRAGSLDEILEATLREGCVGETIAALEAAEAAADCDDAVVAGVLTKIAADEQRHAELAFRFVRWALSSDAHGRRAAVVRRVLEEELDRARRATASADGGGLPGWGLLSSADRCTLRHRGLQEVVAPCLEALLERPTVHDLARPRTAPSPSGAPS